MADCTPPSSVRTTRPSLSVSRRPAGYTRGTSTNSFSERWPASGVNWQSTPYGLLSRISLGMSLRYNFGFCTRTRRGRQDGNGEDQGEESHRGDGWRRDDSHHLAAHPREADPALSRRGPEVLRPRRAETRRDQRPDHGGRGQRDEEARRGGEV